MPIQGKFKALLPVIMAKVFGRDDEMAVDKKGLMEKIIPATKEGEMSKLFLMVCGCILIGAMLFLYAGLYQRLIAHGAERNVNLQNGLYVVTTSSGESLRQLYWDTNQYVIYESLPNWLMLEMNEFCKSLYHKDAEYVGDVRDLKTKRLRAICATPAPFPKQLQDRVCTLLNVGKKKWTWAWVNLHGNQFGCKEVGPPKIGV